MVQVDNACICLAVGDHIGRFPKVALFFVVLILPFLSLFFPLVFSFEFPLSIRPSRLLFISSS